MNIHIGAIDAALMSSSQRRDQNGAWDVELKTRGIVNAKEESEVEWKCMIFNGLLTVANVVCVGCCVYFNTEHQKQSADNRPWLKFLLNLCTMSAGFSVVFSIFLAINERSMRSITHEYSKYTMSDFLQQSIITIFYLVHPNILTQGLEFELNGHIYALNNILSIITCFRAVSVLFFAIKCSQYYGRRTSRVLGIYSVPDNHTFAFAIKSLFHQHGLKTIFVLLIFSTTLLSFSRISYSLSQGESASLLEEVYQTIMTMTTVGFGQIPYSSSVLLRLGSLLVIIIGSFISSALTLTVINVFTFTEQQEKAHDTLERLYLREQIQKRSSKVLKRHTSKRHQTDDQQNQLQLYEYKRRLKECYFSDKTNQKCKKYVRILQSQLRRLVQKQMLITNLMDFYLRRRMKIEEKQAEEPSPRSHKSKGRVSDSVKAGEFFDIILKDTKLQSQF